jgi:hypothetical protein
MILSGYLTSRGDVLEIGLRSLRWLVERQKADAGHFAPIGSNGFWTCGNGCARFDQQPLEAYAMIAPCVEAYLLTRDLAWQRAARRCFERFLGRNDLGQPLYDSSTGGCFRPAPIRSAVLSIESFLSPRRRWQLSCPACATNSTIGTRTWKNRGCVPDVLRWPVLLESAPAFAAAIAAVGTRENWQLRFAHRNRCGLACSDTWRRPDAQISYQRHALGSAEAF